MLVLQSNLATKTKQAMKVPFHIVTPIFLLHFVSPTDENESARSQARLGDKQQQQKGNESARSQARLEAKQQQQKQQQQHKQQQQKPTEAAAAAKTAARKLGQKGKAGGALKCGVQQHIFFRTGGEGAAVPSPMCFPVTLSQPGMSTFLLHFVSPKDENGYLFKIN